MAAVCPFHQWWWSAPLCQMLYQLESQGSWEGWSWLCPPDRPDLLQPLCLACVGPPAAFTPRQFSRVSRSLELALFHQVSPDMSSPLWASLPLCFQPWNPTVEGQPLQVFSLCESFLQLVHLRGACWGHSHPHGFPPGCFPQCLAPWVIDGEFVWFSVENPK